MKRIVVIGGGSGIVPVLKGLKSRGVIVSAIVSVADDGGSSGILRKELGILPPGSVRKPLLALSEKELFWRDFFEYRFEKGPFMGHPLGNIIISAAALQQKSFSKALRLISQIIGVKGEVIPVSLEQTRLMARLENGKEIRGETNIDIPRHDARVGIRRVRLDPPVEANKDALKAIEKADCIIIGPGDLYTSVIPNFLVNGMPEAIKKSKAKKMFICNIMTKHGETNEFSASMFFNALQSYCSSPLDYFVVNVKKPSPQECLLYKEEHSEFVIPDREIIDTLSTRAIYEELLALSLPLRHDSEKLASIILELL